MRLKLRAMLTLAAALSLSALSRADVLEKIPADAWTVLRVNHLAHTSGQIGKLSEKLGLTFMAPMLADPLATLKKDLKLTGIDDDGEMAFVQLDPSGKKPGQAALFLIPSKDYKALIGGLRNATTDGAITSFNFQGMPLFVADWGGYAAVSPSKDVVTAAPSKTLTLPVKAAEKWKTGDFVFFANVNAMRDNLSAQLKELHEQASKGASADGEKKSPVDPKYLPAINEGIDKLFGIGEAFLRDSDGATVAYNISENGISHSTLAEFKSDSYLAQLMNSLQTSDDTLLNNLPGEAPMAFGGFANSPATTAKLIDDIAGPILAKLPADDEVSGKLREMATDTKALLAQMKNLRIALVPSSGAGGAAMVSVADVTGPNILKDMRAFKAKYDPIAQDLQKRAGGGMEWKQTHTPDAKVIDGVNFDQITYEIIGDGEQEQLVRKQLKERFGTETMSQYVGLVGDKMVAFANAGDDTVSALIAAAKGGDDSISKLAGFKSASDALPKPRVAEFYVSGEAILRSVLRLAPMLGQGPMMRVPQDLNLQFPPDVEPLAIGVKREDGALEIDTVITSQFIQAMMTAAMQSFGDGMMNGNNGGI